jgi:hypothetical protein
VVDPVVTGRERELMANAAGVLAVAEAVAA